MSVAALVLGAGSGARYRASREAAAASGRGDLATLPALPKVFALLAGETLLERSLRALAEAPEVTLLQPVLPETLHEAWAPVRARLAELGSRLAEPVTGGAERPDSVRAGLAALPDGIRFVAVHDAARPLVPAEDVRRVVARGVETGAAFLSAPLRDTIHRVESGLVRETPARADCVAALTPQVFRRDWLEAAHDKARSDALPATDDVALVARLGVDVHAVPGDPTNLKITTALDLAAALAILRAREDARAEAARTGDGRG